MTQPEALQKVAEDWGKDSYAYTILERLLGSLKPSDVACVTIRLVTAQCPSIPVPQVRDVMLYLSSERIGLFDFVTAFEANGKTVELPLSETRRFLTGETLHHPDTGNPLTGNDIFVFYRGTRLLQDLLLEEILESSPPEASLESDEPRQ